ncbi:hypothetical protein Pme01_13500 [Planosporangium mesophilum]|uniref:Uncharacterized protein n=2 Tax=Planosporangium mesophilum TaxID=689768 RepID=A0A8J3X2B7_9ACTN|nr:hypothetical protein [Planosporangium mesophilum]GII21753.1 hypothetical protein Pme01_13500 [Planosporangium mesophilum]
MADGSIEELRSLLSWLRDEPAVRRHGGLTVAPGDPEPGSMTTAFEVLVLALGPGLTAAQLVTSIIMWRSSRGPVRVIIERDDREAAIETDDAGEADAIAAKLEPS